MSKPTKDEVMNQLRGRYARAGQKHKTKLIDQAIDLFDYHRKAAIRALRHHPRPPQMPAVDRVQHGRLRGGIRPGTLLRQQIPLRGGLWYENQQGYLEIDTVALCGGRLEGDLVWMLGTIDICTAWVEARAVWNRGQASTLAQLQDIETRPSFALLGLDSDNGGEFLNLHLLHWCQQRAESVKFTRSRRTTVRPFIFGGRRGGRYRCAIFSSSEVVDLPATPGRIATLPPAPSISRRSSWLMVSMV